MDAMNLYQRGKTWWVRFQDHGKHTRRVRAATNRRTAELIARRLAELVDAAAGGTHLSPQLVEWVQGLDEPRRGQLLRWGLVSERQLQGQRSLSQQLDLWEQGLINRGRGRKYAARRRNEAEKLLTAAGARTFGQIDAEAVSGELARWKSDELCTDGTRADYLSAAKGFTRWMQRMGYAERDPLAILQVQQGTPTRKRRALSEDEQRKLVQAAETGPDRYGIPGPARALLYRLALGTGLRASALRRLRVEDVDFAERLVVARSGGASNKKSTPKPISRRLCEAIAEHVERRAGEAPLLDTPDPANWARMLRADAKDAGVRREGLDFHALRHTFGTTLARQGVHPKTLMSLMDHSDINLTMRLYTHSFPEDETQAVTRLPELGGDDDADGDRKVG